MFYLGHLSPQELKNNQRDSVNVGVHQGSVLSPLLFIIVM